MLRNGAREKALSRKVMLSLLMAGTMSVCISGGDVWAALGENAGLTEDTVYNNINEIPVSIATGMISQAMPCLVMVILTEVSSAPVWKHLE